MRWRGLHACAAPKQRHPALSRLQVHRKENTPARQGMGASASLRDNKDYRSESPRKMAHAPKQRRPTCADAMARVGRITCENSTRRCIVNAPLNMNRQAFLTQTVFSGDRRLLPHQVEQAVFAVERKRSLNASETGTGKFLVALAMRLLIKCEAGHIVRCLYTCPKSALGPFEQEFVDHCYRTFVLRHGHDVIPADVDTVLVANSTMLVIHRDQLRSWCPVLVVLDEARTRPRRARRGKITRHRPKLRQRPVGDACPPGEFNIEPFHETTAHRPEDAIVIYGLAEDYERLVLHRVERRPAVFIEMLGKAAAAFDADSAAAVTAEGVVTKQCVICPYRRGCAAALTHGIPAASTGGLDQATLRSVDRLIAARQRAVEAEDEAARARAEAESEIIATLTDNSVKKIKRNGYAVQLKAPTDGEAVLEIRSA
jgi:hypothetical protein